MQNDDDHSDNEEANEAGNDDECQLGSRVDEQFNAPQISISRVSKYDELGVGDDRSPHSDGSFSFNDKSCGERFNIVVASAHSKVGIGELERTI
eukprot:CAMPEP_0170556900 /NCGR_PEP_ID=MMETSP0211-20121228/19038_1 /TAXON_ID=311385 /ORGANISM="Pseudokeronopsis sp., Strain OXSARD2" /LENGTH=93 /DNA_ID=CAMNT_0010867505 /DNA_START=79 /DNA_END=360 /DNA_ORIENTATION=+